MENKWVSWDEIGVIAHMISVIIVGFYVERSNY